MQQPPPTPQYGPPPGAEPGANPSAITNAKLMRGCGGCGCAFAVLASLGGGVLIAFGMQRATEEALPFGIILSGLAVPAAILGGVLLGLGISKLKKLGR